MLSTSLLSDSVTLTVLICLVLFGIVCKSRRRHPPYPPGPRGLPIVGNIFDFPKPDELAKYLAYSKEFGNIYHLSSLGTHIVVVSCPKIANDLLSKKSPIYSGRAPLPMIKDLIGWDFNVAMMDYGRLWKDHRKMLESYLKPSKIPSHHGLLREEVHFFLQNLLDAPSNFARHIDHLAESNTTKLFYGSAMNRDSAYLRRISEQAISAVKVASVPVKYIPSWFPGAAFKRKGEEWRRITREMVEHPFKLACEAMDNDAASSCFVTDVIHESRESVPTVDNLDMVRNCASAGYIGGIDTTASSVSSFFLSMALYPHIQQCAQEELDTVCPGRLPDFEDRPMLPYVNAVCAELLRWTTTVPICMPHTTLEDDIYDGYFIPAGTLVIGNTQYVGRPMRDRQKIH